MYETSLLLISAGGCLGFRYFSYEHFYVIYCKFWELDSDHDFLIDKDDLLRYGNHALTYRIVERIFSQVLLKPVAVAAVVYFQFDNVYSNCMLLKISNNW